MMRGRKGGLIVALLLVAAAACGPYRFPGSESGTGTVTGQVQVIPCGPIEPATAGQDSILPCKQKPAQGLEIDFAADGRTVSTRTDSNGRYAIDLETGTYKVRVNGYMRIVSGPNPLKVSAGDTITANYVVDSGIRTLQ